MDWSQEEYTTPPGPRGQASTAHFGHALYQEGSFGGRLQWASTETSAAYAGHMEGAIRAGFRAARSILVVYIAYRIYTRRAAKEVAPEELVTTGL